MAQAIRAESVSDIRSGTVEQSAGATNLTHENLVEAADTAEQAMNGAAAEIRSIIKAHRLERLLARQLEQQLHTTETTLPEQFANQNQKNETTVLTDAAEEPGHVNVTGNSSLEDKLETIRNGSEVMNAIMEYAVEITSYLSETESNIEKLNESQQSIRELENSYTELQNAYNRALSIVEKQKTHIGLLEDLRTSNTGVVDQMAEEIRQLKSANAEATLELARTETALRESEKENLILSSRLDTIVSQQAAANSNQQSDEAEASLSDIRKLEEELSKARASLNKREKSLEELRHEFSATSKLLKLHEEMEALENNEPANPKAAG